MSLQKQVLLTPLSTLSFELQMQVRTIRNEENIRKWMFTDHLITVEEHQDWLKGLQSDDGQIVFAILAKDEGSLLGIVSVNKLNVQEKKTDWAYYLTESARGGLGSAIEYTFINFIFERLGVDELNCQVIEGNAAVVKLHKKFLFQDLGFANVIKNEMNIQVHQLRLLKEDWIKGRAELKYHSIFERFSIEIEWPQ